MLKDGSFVQFVRSSRGKSLLYIDGYKFYRCRETDNKVFWVCEHYYKKQKCRATAVYKKQSLGIIDGLEIKRKFHSH